VFEPKISIAMLEEKFYTIGVYVSYKGQGASIKSIPSFSLPGELLVYLSGHKDHVRFEDCEGVFIKGCHLVNLGFEQDGDLFFIKYKSIPKSESLKFIIGQWENEWFWAIHKEDEVVNLNNIIKGQGLFSYVHELQFRVNEIVGYTPLMQLKQS
jgi:hypothetical protein